jgi:hypothetical protein
MNKLTETEHVLYYILPSVLIDIINSYYEPYELITTRDVLCEDTPIIIEDGVYNYISESEHSNEYKIIFDYTDLSDIIQYNNSVEKLNRRHSVNSDCVVSFKYNILVSEGFYDMANISDGESSICIDDIKINEYLPKFDEARYITNFKLYSDQIYLSICDVSRVFTDIYRIDLRTKICQYVCKLPYCCLFVSKSFIYTQSTMDYSLINMYNIKDGIKSSLRHSMFYIYQITDNYIFGQLTNEYKLAVEMIDAPYTISVIGSFYKLGFSWNKFYTMHKINGEDDPVRDDEVRLRAYIIDD